MCLQKKESSDSKHLIALILINNVCYSKIKKNQNDQNESE